LIAEGFQVVDQQDGVPRRKIDLPEGGAVQEPSSSEKLNFGGLARSMDL
jgi:hypothetical protein